MSTSGREVNIQVDQEFAFSPGSAMFFKRCSVWARKLNEVTGGGVSLKFWGPPTMLNYVASFWWHGKEVTRLFLEAGVIKKLVDGGCPKLNPTITEKNVDDEMRHGVCQIITDEITRLTCLRARFNATRWDKISISD
ncbi:MAG: hypothetical protein Q8P49_01825 [Candidatus Liptonbacteria bacterium]|nr:hypothetical protein [Candidatus Liptonbacteria bacterium]